MASVTAHLLGLGVRDRDNIIQTIMLMGGSDLGSDDGTAHINAIGLDFAQATVDPRSPPHSPYCQTPRWATFLGPATSDDSTDDSDWHPRYPTVIMQDRPRIALPTLVAPRTTLTTSSGDNVPPTVVEDDNEPKRGVKTSSHPLVFTPAIPKPVTPTASVPKPARQDTLTLPPSRLVNTHSRQKCSHREKKTNGQRDSPLARRFASDDALTPYKLALPNPCDNDNDWPCCAPRHSAPASVTLASASQTSTATTQTQSHSQPTSD
ncbi:hypothetical protein EDB89DRAFT_2079186 [Lactarius sanguifluus]|nr:hypothetical protein EDB89DRAFT_2079186 [Lactarius sanguifluus]